MLSSAAHSKAALVAEHLPGVMPRVYQQTIVNEALIRIVDLGPFKHKIDDGLELRKAAFECMDVLLDNCVDCLDFQAFISHIESGLKVCPQPAPCLLFTYWASLVLTSTLGMTCCCCFAGPL